MNSGNRTPKTQRGLTQGEAETMYKEFEEQISVVLKKDAHSQKWWIHSDSGSSRHGINQDQRELDGFPVIHGYNLSSMRNLFQRASPTGPKPKGSTKARKVPNCFHFMREVSNLPENSTQTWGISVKANTKTKGSYRLVTLIWHEQK
eukprot:CAMPEP_0201530734 /NCGR_PEP_ID=MMETSP0161_2-20130828/45602_1 /ASSEMBLY_ACC=CAM_ASM_000251 /TAXON_ID=180227 /ORGANISM="Neoparamoeba aestuarina, Strain SoJaBio B1-5/56/2" /LENGTH=146 /DNA_ID=CAMNT_0047933243 /DNA_START=327 /DNA_END=767 /DNA_ORIENTATION=+